MRLEPPREGIWLILDEKNDRKRNEKGDLVVSGINDTVAQKPERISTKVGTDLCNDTPRFACGFELNDKGTRWSVLFDKQRLSEVEAIKEQASKILAQYSG